MGVVFYQKSLLKGSLLSGVVSHWGGGVGGGGGWRGVSGVVSAQGRYFIRSSLSHQRFTILNIHVP